MRRTMIAICVLGLLGLTSSNCTTTPVIDKGTSSVSPSNVQLSIVDAHGHLNRDMSAEQLIELMDKAGVSRMVLMARYMKSKRSMGYASDELALEYSKKYPGRFIPFIAGQRGALQDQRRWLEPDYIAEGFLKEIESKLKSGNFYGIGELIIRHYPYDRGDGQGGGENDIPVDTPLMRHLADLAGRYRVPLLIHAEGEPEVVSGMDSLLNYNPKARVIWAHNCGRSSAEVIRKMLARHPNLYCDLGGMLNAPFAGYGRYWPKKTQWIFLIEDGSGHLYPEIKALYEDFSTRFLLGTDCAHTPALKNYIKRIKRFRALLSELSPETARRLAFQNAEELFTK